MRCTKSRAFCIASAIAGSACAPSTRTSSEQPSRGGGSPAAHRPSSGGSSARSQPRRRRRRRCLSVHGGLDRVADGGVGLAHQRYRHGLGLARAWRFDASRTLAALRGQASCRRSERACASFGPRTANSGAAARATTTGCSLSLDALAAPHRRRGRTTAETVYGSSSAARARRGARLRSAGSAPGSASAARSSRACPSKALARVVARRAGRGQEGPVAALQRQQLAHRAVAHAGAGGEHVELGGARGPGQVGHPRARPRREVAWRAPRRHAVAGLAGGAGSQSASASSRWTSSSPARAASCDHERQPCAAPRATRPRAARCPARTRTARRRPPARRRGRRSPPRRSRPARPRAPGRRPRRRWPTGGGRARCGGGGRGRRRATGSRSPPTRGRPPTRSMGTSSGPASRGQRAQVARIARAEDVGEVDARRVHAGLLQAARAATARARTRAARSRRASRRRSARGATRRRCAPAGARRRRWPAAAGRRASRCSSTPRTARARPGGPPAGAPVRPRTRRPHARARPPPRGRRPPRCRARATPGARRAGTRGSAPERRAPRAGRTAPGVSDSVTGAPARSRSSSGR